MCYLQTSSHTVYMTLFVMDSADLLAWWQFQTNLCHACLIHSHSMTMHESRVLQGFDYVLMVNRADALQAAHMGTWRMQTMLKRDGGGDQAG